MKLRQLRINGFGHLHGMDIALQGPATVLYGPNEAGKSTLLGFIRSMFFGIPTRAMSAQRFEPVQGGSHGGVLVITADDGAQWSIERYASSGGSSKNAAGMRGGERLRILRTDSVGGVSEWSQEDLQRELLGGMSREMYNQLFAVSLTELQEVSALRSEEMSRFLFHAGIGGGSSVLRGEKQLLQEMDKLYRPRGRIQEIPRMIQSFEQLEEEAAAMKLLLPRYNEVLAELDQVTQQLTEQEEDLAELDRELAGVKRAAKLVHEWAKREHIRLELAGLTGMKNFPEQGLQRYQVIQTEKERQRLEKREMDRRIEALQQEFSSLSVPSRLIDQENAIRLLAGNISTYEARMQEIGELEAEERSLQERLNRCLRSIHPDWTLEDLNRFAGTVGEQETVRQAMGKFHSNDKELDRVHAERLKLERLSQHAIDSYSSAAQRRKDHQISGQERFRSLVPDTPKEIQALWSEICMELERRRDQAALRYARATAAEVEELYNNRVKSLYKTLLQGGLILTLIIPALIFLISGSIGSTTLTVVFLLLFDLYVWRGSKGEPRKSGRRSKSRGSLPDSESITSPESRLNYLLPRLLRHSLAAGNGIQASGEWTPDWEEEERELRRYMESWQHWDRKYQALLDEEDVCRKQSSQARQQLAILEDELQHRTTIMLELVKEWKEWLLARRLPSDLSPEGALDVFRLAETGRDIAERISAVSMKITRLRSDQNQYEEACNAIELNDVEAPSLDLRVIDRLRYAVTCLEEGQKMQARRELISAKMLPLVEQREMVLDRLSLLSDSERDLLEEAHADDGEEFLRIGAEEERIRELTSELRRLDVFLFGGPSEDRHDEIMALLQQYDEDQLKDIVRDREISRNTSNLKWQQLQEKRGRLLHEKEDLELKCRQETLYQQLEDHRSAMSEATGEYVVRALCLELIRSVRRVYEEERQPAVLQLASNYFNKMTGGTYRRIVMKMGSQELMAEHIHYGMIESHDLSRGTAEQLYLAMRLALSNAVSTRIKLPLLLDDLFVNFDAARLEGTLSVLSEISAGHQIIMMTCHPHVLNAVRRSIPECQVVEL